MPSASCLISPTTMYSGVVCLLSGSFLISVNGLLSNISFLFLGYFADTGLSCESAFND